jgi:hypothetical protein
VRGSGFSARGAADRVDERERGLLRAAGRAVTLSQAGSLSVGIRPTGSGAASRKMAPRPTDGRLLRAGAAGGARGGAAVVGELRGVAEVRVLALALHHGLRPRARRAELA